MSVFIFSRIRFIVTILVIISIAILIGNLRPHLYACDLSNNWGILTSKTRSVRILFYIFPQWHSVPENNRIHGWDFSDWILIQRLRNNKPELKTLQTPTELGWYNLLSYYVRKRQWELLREYGGYGFIYHTYWFTDHPTMDEPMRQLLADNDINVPFMVSWANEDWVARWTGGDDHLIMSVNISSPVSRRKFFQYLLPFFRDKRYIRVQGKPVFQAYQANKDMELVFSDFKRWAIEVALPGLHCHQVLAHFQSVKFDSNQPETFRVPVSVLADGVTEFHPNCLGHFSSAHLMSSARIPRHHNRYHWRGMHVDFDSGPRHRVVPQERSHPFHFERHLRIVIDTMKNDIQKYSLISDEQYVCINGWNEWSEGNTMEPSNIYNRGYLEAMEIVTMKRVEQSKVCILLAASHAKKSFDRLSRTLNSINSYLTTVQWEMLAYSTDQTSEKPVKFMNYIRNTGESRLRVIDVPIILQQKNTSGYDVLRYLIPHCHTVRNSHYIIFLEAGDQIAQPPHPPVDWEKPWHFAVSVCNSKPQWKTAQRIWSLDVNTTLAQVFASEWSRYNDKCIPS